MILKLGMQHQCLKLYKVYIHDDPGLTLSHLDIFYDLKRSNWDNYTFEWWKLLQSHLFWKTCNKQNDPITLINVLMKKQNKTKNMTPGGLSSPAPGLYFCIWPPFSKISFFKTAWPIKAKFYVELPLDDGKKVYIYGVGHMTKMATVPIYVKNHQKSFFL